MVRRVRVARRRFGKFGRKRVASKKYIRRVMRASVEKKYTDYYADDTAISVAGITLPVTTSIVKGTGSNNRVGEKVMIKSLAGRFVFSKHASATQTVVRIVLLRDRRSNGASPSTGFLAGGPTAKINNPMLADQWQRYQIITDKVLVLDSNNPVRTMKLFKRINKTVQWMTGDADPQMGDIYFAVFSNEATNTPYVNYFYRPRFVDM